MIPDFRWLKVGGGIAAALALFGLIWLAQDRFRQKELADDARACAAAARDGTKPLDRCLPDTMTRLEQERADAACDRALMPKLRQETRFIAAQSCRAGTKRLIAVSDSLEAERDNALAEAERARAAIGPAVARAEARAAQSQKRKETARGAIEAAPRDDAGRITCDAECLRKLAQ